MEYCTQPVLFTPVMYASWDLEIFSDVSFNFKYLSSIPFAHVLNTDKARFSFPFLTRQLNKNSVAEIIEGMEKEANNSRVFETQIQPDFSKLQGRLKI